MNIIEVYRIFPTQQECVDYLEKVRWNDNPICPYCKSKKQTPMPKENRYHCNNCNTSFSVMVGTIFENTKLDFQKWFLAISLVLNAKNGISARQLARNIEVTKDTSCYMLMRIRKSMIEYGELLQGIVEANETNIGGKNKNRHADKKTEGGQVNDSKDKTTVIGLVKRERNVIVSKAKNVSSKTLKSFVKENVMKGSQLVIDVLKSYSGLSLFYGHEIVKHSLDESLYGAIPTNTLEEFWSLL